MATELSERQQRILGFLEEFLDDHGYPPSIREICQACGISSTSVADYNLKALEQKGYLRRNADISRGLELASRTRTPVLMVPVLGQIAAGQPIPVPGDTSWTEEAGAEQVEVSSSLARGKRNLFALRVKGQSMIDALINDGDIVVLEPADAAADGDMVAAWIPSDNEATLKKIYREGEQVRLQPANASMAPIYRPAADVEVQGRVVAVLRSL